jgi:hypothetical protein
MECAKQMHRNLILERIVGRFLHRAAITDAHVVEKDIKPPRLGHRKIDKASKRPQRSTHQQPEV